MKSWNKAGIICIMAAVLPMTACGSLELELTEEQNSQVVEYAAGLLLKYDANHHGRLVEEEETKETEEDVSQPAAAPIEEAQEEIPPEDISGEMNAEDIAKEQETVIERNIEEFYSIEGVTISYTGYELRDSYPETGEGDLFFAMNASDGCKLLVLNFDVENVNGQDLNLDMVSLDSKFRVSINGASPKYVLTTMLMNDLASYIGTISAGSSENLVLVCEIPEEEAGSVQSITLLMRSGSEEGQLTLN